MSLFFNFMSKNILMFSTVYVATKYQYPKTLKTFFFFSFFLLKKLTTLQFADLALVTICKATLITHRFSIFLF